MNSVVYNLAEIVLCSIGAGYLLYHIIRVWRPVIRRGRNS